ncbi:HNH endonuclease signature motif containing protein [Nocardioides sp. Kera G14]|uniref:HNH endonuclease signature motif containing protein n=1 Tax=Nocardioides sp. Kera G14 TaxID=2884264 RepID=UPI001D12E8A0|nr:HNH endonuclease signature motif containing protein [Nocardioides sp. Kera G14]UDY22457.1 HNH endonuclease [Nocardioides sp. Kera G14]
MISGERLAGVFGLDAGDLGGVEFLDHVADVGRALRELEVRIVQLAYEWVVRNDAQTVGRREARRRPEGVERVVPVGSAGAEEIAEFSPATLGMRLGMTTYAARELMADATDLHHFFPQLWARVQEFEVKVSYAQHVAKCCRAANLDREQMASVDEAVAESADGRLNWTRFDELVRAATTTCDYERAREEERKRREATFARKLRGVQSGMASFMYRDTLDNITRVDASVKADAEKLAETMPEKSFDERCAIAARMRLLGETPGEGTPSGPDVVIHLHSYADPTGQDSAEEAGFSRIDTAEMVTNAWVSEVFGDDPAAKIEIRPVLDVEGLAPVDSYEIPRRHRRAVEVLFPASVFPWGGRRGPTSQIDHTIAWKTDGPTGQTGIGNLGPLSTREHRLKTHGDVDVKQPFPGIFLWRDAGGAVYLVDASGTRALRHQEPPPPRRRRPSAAELRLATHFGLHTFDVDYDAA